jgi:hypothetical protein
MSNKNHREIKEENDMKQQQDQIKSKSREENNNNNDNENININRGEEEDIYYQKYKNYNQSSEPSCRQIIFGDGLAWEVVDPNLIQNLQYHFLRNFDDYHHDQNRSPKKTKKFPGALPVALTKKNIDLLKSAKKLEAKCESNNKIFSLPDGKLPRYSNMREFDEAQEKQNMFYVTRKSNGTRYMLMFDYRDYDRSHDCYQTLWDRKMKPLLVKFKVPDFIHQDTIIDGELVKEPDGTHIFYCFDLIVSNGRSFIHRSLVDRLKALDELTLRILPCPYAKESPFTLKTKKFMPVTQLMSFLKTENLEYYFSNQPQQNQQNQNKHPCDGLLFIENLQKIQIGTAHRQLKWKPPHECTIDFLIMFPENNNRTCDLYIRSDQHQSPPSKKELLWKTQWITSTFDSNTFDFEKDNKIKWIKKNFNGKIIECFFNQSSSNWQYKLTRHDKNSPNFVNVVNDTINSIKDNINIKNLVDVIFS